MFVIQGQLCLILSLRPLDYSSVNFDLSNNILSKIINYRIQINAKISLLKLVFEICLIIFNNYITYLLLNIVSALKTNISPYSYKILNLHNDYEDNVYYIFRYHKYHKYLVYWSHWGFRWSWWYLMPYTN